MKGDVVVYLIPYIDGLEIDYEESGMLGGFTMNKIHLRMNGNWKRDNM